MPVSLYCNIYGCPVLTDIPFLSITHIDGNIILGISYYISACVLTQAEVCIPCCCWVPIVTIFTTQTRWTKARGTVRWISSCWAIWWCSKRTRITRITEVSDVIGVLDCWGWAFNVEYIRLTFFIN